MIEYADGTDSIIQQHNRLLSSLGPLSQLLQIRQTYSSPLFHGVSINLRDNNNNDPPSTIVDTVVNKATIGPHHPVLFEQLIRSPDVLNIYPIMQVPQPQWIEEEEDNVHLPYENKLSQLKDIHQSLNITGSGITVGILDSGSVYTITAMFQSKNHKGYRK
ncbi:hypothetical protein BDB00DRAFT_814593 [Zychaea mexicana]|uniref:uncharacterized protein n=1 Tax=Zychaea mexicana TaxID=64656 RepID=UPI0022FEA528|nr:uncharacterized protein BDB00DRAFT_814593 [Zychaea mexicana]KAI9495423.1 hypothetical protein BDB00DRAFT_814593 [Zychaea mexicana]